MAHIESRDQRATAFGVLHAALRAVDPVQAVQRYVQRSGAALRIGQQSYDLTKIEHIYVVGTGKAGATMASAIEDILGDRLTAGWVNTKYGHRLTPSPPAPLPTLGEGERPPLDIGRQVGGEGRLIVHEAGHPVPDENGVAGTQRIMALLEQAGPNDLVIALISGGGSALMLAPAEGLALHDKQTVTKLMLACGATINELNCVRKHLSAIKGGQLARLAQPAQVATLILSDVVGNPLDVIASGPTVPDSTTFADAWAILDGYGLIEQLPTPVRLRLQKGRAGEIADTPKAGDPLFANVANVIIGSNDLAAEAAVTAARAAGLNALLLSTYVEGEAREVARVLAGILREINASGHPLARPCCVVVGGETTVTLRGHGMGGRNQELALAAALRIAGLPDVVVVACGTDGSDGPTDAAGAIADGQTLARARALGLDAAAYLANNDSYHYFQALGDLLITGPTGTNVNDLTLLFAF
jgi:hydroxypyruvate reductase